VLLEVVVLPVVVVDLVDLVQYLLLHLILQTIVLLLVVDLVVIVLHVLPVVITDHVIQDIVLDGRAPVVAVLLVHLEVMDAMAEKVVQM
jgi:hypothetical protein